MKQSTFLIIASVIFFGCFLRTDAQSKKANSFPPVRLERKLPTVLISLDSPVLTDLSSGDGERLLRLRLRNNSRWLIKLEASGGIKGVDDAKLYYDVLDQDGNIAKSHGCHVCSIVGLASGKSIVFTLPYRELMNSESIRIKFEFEWEDKVAVAPAEEPTHYVFFRKRYLDELK